MKLFKKSAKEITNPIDYLHENIGKADDCYTVALQKVPNVSNAICRSFPDKNNCTLVALCNITQYYASKTDGIISMNVEERYRSIRELAKKLGYDGEHGLSVFKNRRFANLFCKTFFKNRKIKGCCRYFITRKRAIQTIEANRPFLLSLASGYYFDHTVAVFGYANYTNHRIGKTYTFLMLYDSWHNTCRYLPWKNTGAFHITCMTELVDG